MSALSSNFFLSRKKLLNFYLCRYLSPCEKYFSSKDTTDEKSTSKELDKNEDEKQLEGKQKLDVSKSETHAVETKEAAKRKLFSLLSELKVSPDKPKIKPDLVLAKPSKRPTKAERFQHLIKKSPKEQMELAVKAVAENIGGDPKETQLELKERLNSLDLSPGTAEAKQVFKPEDLGIDEKVQENLMSSVKDVASTVTAPIKSELTHRLLRLSKDKKLDPSAKVSVENMMKGMKIDKSKSKAVTTEEPVRRAVTTKEPVTYMAKERQTISRPRVRTKINLYQSAPLDIFSLDVECKLESKKTVWQSLEEKRLKLLTEFAPANAFEEMIMWTDQGKHWKFPIDNEIEMGKEENVGFNEHVFLEQHLHGFPTKGPIRHFMELVVVGLSKNPYITVERKIENINWFRDYFKEKEDILKQCGISG